MTFKQIQGEQFHRFFVGTIQKFITDNGLTESEMLEYSNLFPKWESGLTVYRNDIYRHKKDSEGYVILYKIIGKDSVITQGNISPDSPYASSIYQKIGYNADGVRIWSRPMSDGYPIDRIVSFNNELYRNTIEGNQFSPDRFGWEKL